MGTAYVNITVLTGVFFDALLSLLSILSSVYIVTYSTVPVRWSGTLWHLAYIYKNSVYVGLPALLIL